MSHFSIGPSATSNQACRPGLSTEIESDLHALADLEACYEVDRERLMLWPDPEGIKQAFLEQLQARHAWERQPLIQRLAYLQRTTTTARMLSSLFSVH